MSERIRDRGDDYGLTRRDGFAMTLPGGRTAIVNMTHVETPLDPFEASKKGMEGKEQADRTMTFLKIGVSGGVSRRRACARMGCPGFVRRAGSSGAII